MPLPPAYMIAKAAHYYGMNPEEAASLPVFWIEWALIGPAAEAWVESELIKQQT